MVSYSIFYHLKCNNFAYFQRVIFNFIFNCSCIIKIYVLKNNGEVYNVNAYYDVIDDFITIYNNLKMVLSSYIYVIDDVIMCSDVKYFPVIYFWT